MSPTTLREKIFGLQGIWPMLVPVFILLGGIYTGITPPTPAGAFVAVGALAISVVRRRITTGKVREAFKQTAELTSVLFILIIAGGCYSRASWSSQVS